MSCEQFVSLSKEFKVACEKSFNGPCDAAITFMVDVPVTTTFYDEDESARLAEINNAATITTAASLDGDFKALWKNSAYVGLTFRPVDEEKAPSSAFATLEFKGRLPKSAIYYVQGPADETCEALLGTIAANNSGLQKGDGFDSNTFRSATGLILQGMRSGNGAMAARILSKSNDYSFK